MKHSWLVDSSNSFKNIHFFSFFFFSFNPQIDFTCFNAYFFFKKISFLFFFKNAAFSNLKENIKFKLTTKYTKNANYLEIIQKNRKIQSNFLLLKNKLKYKFIDIFFLFNDTVLVKNVNKTAYFNFFYFNSTVSGLNVIDFKKLTTRWEFTFDFLFNVFFFQISPLIFSSPLFKKQTLSFNWVSHNWEKILWKYYFTFFVFKFNKNTKKFNFFCLKLQEMGLNILLVTDVSYHFKNLYAFREFQFYTIGLVPMNFNPWVVNFPIPAAYDSYLTQLFFFKILSFIKKNSLLEKYFFYKKIINYGKFIK